MPFISLPEKIFQNITRIYQKKKMFKNIPSLNTSLSLLVLLVIGVLIFFSSVFIALAILSMAIVPLTLLWGLITGQTYDRVCDNSELVYKLN